MDIYDNWGCASESDHEKNIHDLDCICRILSRCSHTGVIRKLLEECFDTSEKYDIFEEVGYALDVTVEKIVYSDELNRTITMERINNDEGDEA